MAQAPNGPSGILLITHGHAGEELIRSAEMIIGPIANIAAVALLPGMSPEHLIAEARDCLERMGPGTLVLTDLFGGTPSNVALNLSQSYEIAVVTGLNLGMLIQAVESRETLKGEALAGAVTRAGQEAVRDILAELRTS